MSRKVKLFLLFILLMITCVVLVTYTDITGIHMTWLSFLTPENKSHTVSVKYDNELISLFLQKYEEEPNDNDKKSHLTDPQRLVVHPQSNVHRTDTNIWSGTQPVTQTVNPIGTYLTHQLPTPGVTETGKTLGNHFSATHCSPATDASNIWPCVDPACNTTFLPPRPRLERLVSTQYNLTSRHLEVLRSLGARVPPADLVFLTAASDNHFEESQGVIRDLHQKVFPWLSTNTNYSYNFIYYNLGLDNKSLALLTKYCRCHVLGFPFQSLPDVFKNLKTYNWKPLIVKAHSSHSKLLMWMDASVRFKSGDVSLIIQRVMADGFFIQHDGFMMPRHVMPGMLQYFHTEACLLAPFYETESGFVVVKNEPLMSKAVLDPWVACAFAPRCIYPGDDWSKLLKCPGDKRGYSVCHRFDQAALGVILVTLFDFKSSQLVAPYSNVIFRRNDKVKYFPTQLK